MMDLHEQVHSIQQRDDLIAFVRALSTGARSQPEQWQNRDLAAYLDALAAWMEDTDGYFLNVGEPVPDQPTWKMIGQGLLAATAYE